MKSSMLTLVFVAFLISFGSGEHAPSREIELSELDYYVNTEEGREILINDFKSVKGGQRKPWTVAVLPENLKKNRYEDLLPFDDTRVVLELLPGHPNSDYINANYINGYFPKSNNSLDISKNEYEASREYIATQGPLPNTVNDFWRMIWEQNTTKIVMLANVFEHGKIKVEKYWPDTTNTYGDIVVTKISHYEIPRLQHVIRTFSVQKEGVTTPRVIRHFHYTGWPDMGVPEEPLSVLSLMLQARKYKPESKAPIVVHCSAGVGRTGTIILTDSSLQQALAEEKVDILKRLDEMRDQRVDVVEKEGQYIFAHKAIYEYFYGNNTEEFLRIVELDYRNIEDEYQHNSSGELSHILKRIKWHNKGIGRLIDVLSKTKLEDFPDSSRI